MKFQSSCSSCFAGLSCDVRVNIVNLLQKKKKMGVLEIAKYFKVTQPTITHHLQYLQEMEILKSEKSGRNVYYFIHPKCGKKICQLFL